MDKSTLYTKKPTGESKTMAISFNKQKGSAQKSSNNSYKYVDGDNKVRIVGDILARYVYWIKGENDKNLPLECLSFDRDAEAFTNKEKDWVREYYPDLKCGWSYATQCIDPKDGQVKVLNLKKKLWEQVITAAEDLGDPTDVESGWDYFQTSKNWATSIQHRISITSVKVQNSRFGRR